MSNALFPSNQLGVKWSSKKTPVFSTLVQESVSGMETRAALQAYPRWQWELSFEDLRSDDGRFQAILGFFLQHQGMFDSFLYDDPEDNSIAAQQIGTGDGSTTGFQLVRTYGGFTEPVKNLNGAPQIYTNAVLQTSGYSISTTGLVTFTSAPAMGTSVTATFSYYWRARFLEDQAEFQNVAHKLWELQKLGFISVK